MKELVKQTLEEINNKLRLNLMTQFTYNIIEIGRHLEVDIIFTKHFGFSFQVMDEILSNPGRLPKDIEVSFRREFKRGLG